MLGVFDLVFGLFQSLTETQSSSRRWPILYMVLIWEPRVVVIEHTPLREPHVFAREKIGTNSFAQVGVRFGVLERACSATTMLMWERAFASVIGHCRVIQ